MFFFNLEPLAVVVDAETTFSQRTDAEGKE
jgi:hypothetical protein